MLIEQAITSPQRPAPIDNLAVRHLSASIAGRVVHVARGALPAVLTATLIPLGLFYAVSAVGGMKAGIIASLSWAYLVLARQLYTSRRASGLLTITAFTLTVRCITWGLHQTPFTYFSVPVAETVGIASLFLVTLVIGRPLLISLARDFVPALGDRLTDVSHRRLVRHVSCIWALVYLGSAATSATLLLTQNIHFFLLFHQASSWTWVAGGLAATFAYGRRHGQELVVLATTGIAATAGIAGHVGDALVAPSLV